MPDLEQEAVTDWLTGLRHDADAMTWPPAIRPLETEEDAPLLATALGRVLDDISQHDLAILADALHAPPLREDFKIVLAQLGAARVLRLLHWLSESDIPYCDAVIRGLLSGDDASGRALRATVGAVTRRATLRRIFAAERIATLEDICTPRPKEHA